MMNTTESNTLINQLYTSTIVVGLSGIALLGLGACADEVGEADRVELREGIELTLREGTHLDMDELESREGYATTLFDPDEAPWLLRTQTVTAEALEELGLEQVTVEGRSVELGPVWQEDGADCRIYVPIEGDEFVVLSRLEEAGACPDMREEVEDWLPGVNKLDGVGQMLRAGFNTKVGSFNGVDAYSNGSVGNDSKKYSTCGLKWQCVEYANRYYYEERAHKNLKHTGHAKHYYATAYAKGLYRYANGGSVKPKVGDMIVSEAGTYGHIAIVRAVGSNYVRVIQQNWSNSSSDNSKYLSMTVSNGKYTVAGFSGNYPIKGWLRPKGCKPSVTSVSPSWAPLNQSKIFTVSGSCLSDMTTTAWIAQCKDLDVLERGSTKMRFSCTPSYSKGTMGGVVKHAENGTELKNFTVTVY